MLGGSCRVADVLACMHPWLCMLPITWYVCISMRPCVHTCMRVRVHAYVRVCMYLCHGAHFAKLALWACAGSGCCRHPYLRVSALRSLLTVDAGGREAGDDAAAAQLRRMPAPDGLAAGTREPSGWVCSRHGVPHHR